MNYQVFPLLLPIAQRRFKNQMHGTDEEKAALIKSAVSEVLNIEISLIESKNRHRLITEARHISIALIRQRTKMSLKTIAKLFGDRDHSTIIYAIQNFNDLMETNRPFIKKFDDVEKYLTIEKQKKSPLMFS